MDRITNNDYFTTWKAPSALHQVLLKPFSSHLHNFDKKRQNAIVAPLGVGLIHMDSKSNIEKDSPKIRLLLLHDFVWKALRFN